MHVRLSLYIAVHLCAWLLAFVTSHYTLGVTGFALRPFCASLVTGGFFTFHAQTEDFSTDR